MNFSSRKHSIIKMKILTDLLMIVCLVLLKESETQSAKCEEKTNCNECVQTKGCAWCSKPNGSHSDAQISITNMKLTKLSPAKFLQSLRTPKLDSGPPWGEFEGESDWVQSDENAYQKKVKYEIYATTSLISKCHPSEKILEICQKEFSENPETTMKIIANRPMRNGGNGNTVQIRPQEVFLKLKPEDEFGIVIEFKKAENYPVDLYYLMDFSSSMSKHKNNLSKLGNKLVETMKNITSDFQLGFGSFVDKVVLPFTSTLPSHLLRPCSKCSPPYSFKNHMSLTRETTKFAVEVDKAQLSGNIDTPEGTLDALMQTIVCQKQINWREKSRHIIVLSTDAPFHLAGDGKLGGVMEPHDGLCYLDEKGVYTHSLVFDYPSISQISHKALANNMNIIFAVVNKVKNEYLSLSKEIRGSSLGLLDAGENIAELIRIQYEKITTTIRLTDNAKGPVHLTYSALCSENEKWKNSNECTNIKGGTTIYFRVHITISDCSDENLRNQKIMIKPVGMNETLTIHLESICHCGCLAANHPANEINSKFCSNSGDLICGLCNCNERKIGKNCECSGTNEEILKITDTEECVSKNLTNEICSGHGECRCGICQCYPRQNPKEERTGKYCECDNYSCERPNGLMCSGHGICKCGKCACDPEWSGEVCDCPMNTLSCRMDDEEVCSGKGDCICGNCICRNNNSVNEYWYGGKYCQVCLTCVQCHLHNDCVECLSYGTGPYAENQCKNCTKMIHHNLVKKLEEVEKNNSGVSCTSADHSGCTFRYYYLYKEDNQLVVWSEAETICPKEINLYAVVGGTVGSTVLLGLLSLIIWKVLVEIHDKREYEKFEKERHLARWEKGENPLFKTATSTYENPTYAVDSC